MKIKKEILVNGKKAVLSYNDAMFGKDANILKYEEYKEAEIIFIDNSERVALYINGEEYYSDDNSDYLDDFYFEVLDLDKFDNELACSDAIYESISNEEELLKIMIENSYFINNMDDFKVCPKGFTSGFCDEETSSNCKYSSLTRDGLCGAECQDCMGEMYASREDEAYVCECSKILFGDRHTGIRELQI